MIDESSVKWAIQFIVKHSDGDLFPRLYEIEAINSEKDEFAKLFKNFTHDSFPPGASRRFIVPKDEISYRQATQLDPQDSVLLSAMIYQYGIGIENRRLSKDQIFSYRFSPDIKHGLYSNREAWNQFWTKAKLKSEQAKTVLYCDIADFYNQIYHHIVENQLNESNFPNQVTKWIIKLLESTTAGVSRGIPVGPHSIHLLAEASLIPIDNCIQTYGYDFIRYADDIIIFCDSDKKGRQALAQIASILDKQQRLMLSRHKTKFYTPDDFSKMCQSMIEDRPISDEEDEVLNIIKKYSEGDPYLTITYDEISDEDWNSISDTMIENIISEYIKSENVDYIRLRWFFRRLTQIGHPGAVKISLSELYRLGPCFSNICTYLASVQKIPPEKWKEIGEKLILLLDSDEVANNEYFRLSILSLFTRNPHINHFSKLIEKYSTSEAFVKREILLTAKESSSVDWLREHKENFQSMDPWLKSAFIYCMSIFPRDEKKYFLNKLKIDRPFDKVLCRWSKNT